MSEEILIALMRLFAIIAKQDEETNNVKVNFVRSFLKHQLSEEKVDEYFLLFEEYYNENKRKGDDAEEKRTSVTDSVRILGICKKIGKSLTQHQKIIVLVRLFELIKSDNTFTKEQLEIIDTASKVFKIDTTEYKAIENFVISDTCYLSDTDNILALINKSEEEKTASKHIITFDNLVGAVFILKIESVNLYFIRYIGNIQVHLNGNTLPQKGIYLLASGSVLRLPVGRPLYYSEIISRFVERASGTSISFEAKNITYKFPNGAIGLRNINVAEREGNLIGLMGSSGAGKTTLLNVLSGIETPSEGEVIINNNNLHQNPKALDGVIGFVPQDDLLFEELTVYNNLYFNAKICFKNLSEKALEHLVLKTLDNLGLAHIKDLKVGNVMNKTISGGQRKRLNIGLELIREPSILFLDEPTSGLSSKDSENVLDLLRELSFKGKLIFVVIHQPSSDIYKMFDKIILLDTGGYQVFYGNPVEAVSYFKKIDAQINSEAGECTFCGTVNPETMFKVIEAKEVDEYGNYAETRKIKPERWNALYKENSPNLSIETVSTPPPSSLRLRNKLQQFAIFFKRDFLSKLANKQYLFINLLEAPVLAFFLSFVIRYITNPKTGTYLFRENENIAAYIFMSVVVAMFIGLTVSAEEIFKDRMILKREEFLKLSRLSYLLSKAGLLFILSAIQTLSFVLIGNFVLEIYGLNLSFWIMLFSISCLANILGLVISSSFNSAVTIYIIIPLLIIPQLILGGAMFSYEKLNHLIGGGIENDVPFVANFMPARWGYEGLVVNAYTNNEYGKLFYDTERKESLCNYKQSYYIPKLKELLNESKGVLASTSGLKTGQAMINLQIIKNEILKENSLNPSVKYPSPEKLDVAHFNTSVVNELYNYLAELSSFYSITYLGIVMKKEQLLAKSEESASTQIKKIKDAFFNENLNEILTNSLLKKKILVTENYELKQKIDPVYNYPEKALLSVITHFYAPKKYFFGNLVSTFSFNLITIWIYTLLLFIFLYFNILTKIFNIKIPLFKSKNE
ncbi:MAG: ATP-binding cassette domain-containing protein [Vicingaceae bacterium]|nr:ATP-binding cassette domain-containing protein [Vicingaceae bacterium]